MVAFNIWIAGGRAVRFGTGRGDDLDPIDGLIIGGGDDISPDLYNGRLVTSAHLDPEHDALELDLLHRAFEQNMPVLGICRGSQMLNVALGGTLDPDAYQTYRSSQKLWTILPKKRIKPCESSLLAQISGGQRCR